MVDPAPPPDALAVLGRRSCVRQAMLGTLIWAVWLSLAGLRTVDALLLLSPLVLHPLVLGLSLDDAPPSRLWHAARLAQAPGAAMLVLAIETPAGTTAGLYALPWLFATGVCAAYGASRILRRSRHSLHEAGRDAALVFVLVGAGWVVASRLGLAPLGFSPTIVLLTGVHFHYAGLVLPTLATLVARELGPPRWRAVPLAIVAGVVLVAAGITLSPWLEVIASIVLGAAGVAVAAGQLLVARRSGSSWGALLLALSSLSLMFAMALAAIYAVGEVRGLPWPPIPDMVVLHGTANALGTSLLGVWGWTVHRS